MSEEPKTESSSFAEQAEESEPSFLVELWDFIRFNKKWWLLPIVAFLVLLMVVVLVGGSPVAPFIYAIF